MRQYISMWSTASPSSITIATHLLYSHQRLNENMSHHSQQPVKDEPGSEQSSQLPAHGHSTQHFHGSDTSANGYMYHGSSMKAEILSLEPPMRLFSTHLTPDRCMQIAPSCLFTETAPVADFGPCSSEAYSHTHGLMPQPNFAARANQLIDDSLGRTPDGTSVIDPDSVLDESGRLYHGYRDGKYLLPNDAVSDVPLS